MHTSLAALTAAAIYEAIDDVFHFNYKTRLLQPQSYLCMFDIKQELMRLLHLSPVSETNLAKNGLLNPSLLFSASPSSIRLWCNSEKCSFEINPVIHADIHRHLVTCCTASLSCLHKSIFTCPVCSHSSSPTPPCARWFLNVGSVSDSEPQSMVWLADLLHVTSVFNVGLRAQRR